MLFLETFVQSVFSFLFHTLEYHAEKAWKWLLGPYQIMWLFMVYSLIAVMVCIAVWHSGFYINTSYEC